MMTNNFFAGHSRCAACLTYKPHAMFSYDKRKNATQEKYCDDCHLEHPELTGVGFFWDAPSVNKTAKSIRSSIARAPKYETRIKKTNTQSVLGCDFGFFQEYLASQFTSGMTLENHGLWHIDHKIPISWARNNAEMLLLNHFSNFRPLWAKRNIAKGNRLSACGLTQEKWYEANPIPLNTAKTEN